MEEKKVNVRVPLFDRLVTPEEGTLGASSKFPRSLDREGLIESVRRELEQLFNTRCSVPAHELDGTTRSVLDYGIPDFTHLSAQSPDDRARLLASLRQAIEAFEPRLRVVQVAVEDFTRESQSFSLRIDGLLVVDNVRESVSFKSVVPTKRGKSQVYGLE